MAKQIITIPSDKWVSQGRWGTIGIAIDDGLSLATGNELRGVRIFSSGFLSLDFAADLSDTWESSGSVSLSDASSTLRLTPSDNTDPYSSWNESSSTIVAFYNTLSSSAESLTLTLDDGKGFGAIKIGNTLVDFENVEIVKIGTEKAGVLKIGNNILWRASDAPPPPPAEPTLLTTMTITSGVPFGVAAWAGWVSWNAGQGSLTSAASTAQFTAHSGNTITMNGAFRIPDRVRLSFEPNTTPESDLPDFFTIETNGVTSRYHNRSSYVTRGRGAQVDYVYDSTAGGVAQSLQHNVASIVKLYYD